MKKMIAQVGFYLSFFALAFSVENYAQPLKPEDIKLLKTAFPTVPLFGEAPITATEPGSKIFFNSFISFILYNFQDQSLLEIGTDKYLSYFFELHTVAFIIMITTEQRAKF